MSSFEARQVLLGHFALVGKALSHGNRLHLLEMIAQGERDVDSLAGLARLSVANTSQHLQLLRRAGLVTSRKTAQRVIYRLTDDSVISLLTALRSVAESNLAGVETIVAGHFRKKDELEPVSRDELMLRMREGSVTLVDVRPSEEFASGHLPGATNIPVAELGRKLRKIPRSFEIVAYCRGPYCALAYDAVAVLRQKGFQARRLEDGFPEWRAAGLPIEQNSEQRKAS